MENVISKSIFYELIVKAFNGLFEDFDHRIFSLFHLDAFRDLIYENDAAVSLDDGIEVGLVEDIGLVVIEIWFQIRRLINELICSENIDFNQVYHSFLDCFVKGLNRALEKYQNAFELYVHGKVIQIFGCVSSFFGHNDIAGEKTVTVRFKEACFAAIRVMFNTEYPRDIRLKAALDQLAIGCVLFVRESLKGCVVSVPALSTLSPMVNEIIEICSMKLIALIHSGQLAKFIDSVVQFVNSDVEYFMRQTASVEAYAAELMQIDLDKFKNEIDMYANYADLISTSASDVDLNRDLKRILKELCIFTTWDETHGGDFNKFMQDKTARMIFE